MIDNNQLSLHSNLPAMQSGGGTRTSHRWTGEGVHQHNLDTLNLRAIWPSGGEYDMPIIQGTEFEPSMLAAWNLPAQREKAAEEDGAIHFFLDDYRFESVWRNPDKYFPRIQLVGAALTPDYSIYAGSPIPTQIWQIYRQRWLGAFWQFNGIEVIPAVRWGEPNTYDFVFEGLPYGSNIAIGSLGPGSRTPEALLHFERGLKELIRRINPNKLLVYGKLHVESEWLNLPPVREYPTWREIAVDRGVPKNKPKTDSPQEGEEEWPSKTTLHDAPPELPLPFAVESSPDSSEPIRLS